MEKIERLRGRSCTRGWPGHGITGELADDIYARIQAFANFGFAESHAISFGLLVYASSWLKLHYPGAFLAGLLRAQPMGFYSPQSLVADARRHGVRVLRPDIARSGVHADLEPLPELVEGAPSAGPTGMDELPGARAAAGRAVLAATRRTATREHRRDGELRGPARADLGAGDRSHELAETIVAEREPAPFTQT